MKNAQNNFIYARCPCTTTDRAACVRSESVPGSSHSQGQPGGVQTESEVSLHLGPTGRGRLGQI